MPKKYKKYEPRLRRNNQIRIPEISVVDETGKSLGTMKTYEALKLAQESGLDLVEVGPTAKPPLAKILDFGKFMYDKEKRKSHSKHKDPSQEIKIVKIGFKTGGHDLEVSAGQIDKFLKKGHRVTINMSLRGREKAMARLGEEKIKKFPELLKEPFEIESPAKRFPMGFTMTVKPSKK